MVLTVAQEPEWQRQGAAELRMLSQRWERTTWQWILAPTLPANATLSIRTHAQSLSALFPYLLNENNADLIVCCHYLLRSCPKTALAQDLPFPRKKRKYGCGSVGKVFVFGA